ncbi:MAG: flavodoxin-dependent (E)-4-hydroxy-3-methylbut-2-enyl-diphosphate synthase [Oligosphaeraceae bacterium]
MAPHHPVSPARDFPFPMRHPTRQIHVGSLPIGGDAPIAVQSMCCTPAEDAEATLAQVARLARAGCQLVRVAYPSPSCRPALERICRESPLPVVADIHFDGRLALSAMEAGVQGIRLNPGNLARREILREVAREAAACGCAVRVGVNMGSLSPRAREKHGPTAQAMVESAREFLGGFEDAGCVNLKVSLKASDIPLTLEACRRFRPLSPWPLHLGLTEAGTPASGIVKSSIALGALLLEGIGDTIRVSLTAQPEEEVAAAFRILDALGLRPGRPQLVSCPTCGRTRIALIPLAEKVEAEIQSLLARGYRLPFRKIAVMGCEVNGPGEAADADLGIAGGAGRGVLFRQGRILKVLPEAELFPALQEELRRAALPPDPR